MPVRRWGARSLVVGVLCVLATACSAPAPPGPDTGAGTRAQCVVGDPQGEVIVLPGSLTPSADTVLEGARPDGAVNLEVVEQAVVAFDGRAGVQGVVTDYPPAPNADLADSLARWDERRPLPGLRVGPADGQQAVLVALRLTDPSRSGHLDGVTLASTRGGEDQVLTFVQPLLVEPPERLCTVQDVDATRDWVAP